MSNDDAREFLERIFEQRREVEKLRGDWGEKDGTAKAAKKRLEAAQEELEDLIAKGERDYPLFDRDQPKSAPVEAVEESKTDESWREELIYNLDAFGLALDVVEKLYEADFSTIGDLASLTDHGGKLTDISGIGPAKAEAIEAALVKFWAARGGDPDAAAAPVAVVEERPDGGPVEAPAWRSVPLRAGLRTIWSHEREAAAFRSACDALAEPIDDDEPGIVTLGDLADQITGLAAKALDELKVVRPAGQPGIDGGLADDEVAALRSALLSYRERDAEFAAAVPVGDVDPAAERKVFIVRFKKGRGSKVEPEPRYVRANSRDAAVEHAERWDDAKSVDLFGGEIPDGVIVHEASVEGRFDRHQTAVAESMIDDQIAAEREREAERREEVPA